MNNINNNPSVAVIGAGIAGISCAAALQQAAPHVKVFEKSAAAGGRMTTRANGQFQFDCGAQYFTVRSDVFQRQVDEWQKRWLADEWSAWLVDLNQGQAISRDDQAMRYVSRPHMQSCVQEMAELCDIQYKTRVAQIIPQNDGWDLRDIQDNSLGIFKTVVVAVPAPQAIPLLASVPDMAAHAAGIDMTACWSGMYAFDNSLQLGFDGAFVVTPELMWIARDTSKPDRNGLESWVVHSSPEWADSHLDVDSIDVIELLLKCMERACGRPLPLPEYADAKLWRYAMPVNPLGVPFLFDRKLKIGACGDWCLGAKVEAAYLSGLSMAAALLRDGE